ncbi:MAG: nucleoside/nucleotide kinase family protein [Propionibacteriaceae bacterium]|nr:nucleoside/nucleotide kinase family protein [Propionibacteriaceae bacterium]
MSSEPLPVDVPALAGRLRARASAAPRVVVGLCGAPGAGKSTLAGQLADELNSDIPGTAVVVPMDGFHLAASVIATDDRATRRGAPDTFDPDGYAALLRRLRRNREAVVYAPEYRREIEDPVAGAIAVPHACPVVVTEGNYLLHPDPAWRRVRDQLDEVWFVEAPSEGLRVTRLIERHEHFGKSPEHARRHVFGSDERNAAQITGHKGSADLVLRWPGW